MQNHIEVCTLKTVRELLETSNKVERSVGRFENFHSTDALPNYDEEILSSEDYSSLNNHAVDLNDVSERHLNRVVSIMDNEKFVEGWLKSCPVAVSKHFT